MTQGKVPSRGDGFDSVQAETAVQGIAQQLPTGYNLKSLSVAQIMALAKVSDVNARIIKNTIAVGGGGIGALIGREINEALGGHMPDWAAMMFGGAVGGALAGLATGQIKKKSPPKRRYNDRRD